MDSPVKEWTEGRFRSFITSVIRGGFRRFPNKYNALKVALVGKETNPSSGRMANMYLCVSCEKKFPQTGVQVDHIDPVVSTTGFLDWDTFITRLYCPIENLQVLCKPCHLDKTKTEKTKRKT